MASACCGGAAHLRMGAAASPADVEVVPWLLEFTGADMLHLAQQTVLSPHTDAHQWTKAFLIGLLGLLHEPLVAFLLGPDMCSERVAQVTATYQVVEPACLQLQAASCAHAAAAATGLAAGGLTGAGNAAAAVAHTAAAVAAESGPAAALESPAQPRVQGALSVVQQPWSVPQLPSRMAPAGFPAVAATAAATAATHTVTQASGLQDPALPAPQQQQQQQQQVLRAQLAPPAPKTDSVPVTSLTFAGLCSGLQIAESMAAYQLLWQFACRSSPDVLEPAAALVAPVLRVCSTNALAQLQEQPSTGQQGGAGTSGSSMAAGEAAAPIEVTAAQLLLPLLSEPVLQDLLPPELVGLLQQLAGHRHQAGADSAIQHASQQQAAGEQQQQEEDKERLRTARTSDAPQAAPSTAAIAATSAPPPGSLAALLEQLQHSSTLPDSNSSSTLADQASKLHALAVSHFGQSLADADLVVTNYLYAAQERARQCAAAAAAATLADRLAARHFVDGVLQLAAQPAITQLLEKQELQGLTAGLAGCRDELVASCGQL